MSTISDPPNNMYEKKRWQMKNNTWEKEQSLIKELVFFMQYNWIKINVVLLCKKNLQLEQMF